MSLPKSVSQIAAPHSATRMNAWSKDLAARELALQRDRAFLDSLMSQISHALQEPVRAICSFGRILESEEAGDLSEPAREYLSFITRGARQIEFSMQGWVRLSHVATRAQPITKVDLRACLDTAVAVLRTAINPEAVHFNIGPLPHVASASNHAVDLFRELLVNSIIATHADALTISITAETRDGRVHISISDNGRGFDPRRLRRFDRVLSLETSDRLGFGLAVCHQIVARTGGTLEIDSKPECGTTVHFDLPAWEGASDEPD